MITAVTTEERELDLETITNILKLKVNDASIDCVGIGTGLNYDTGDEIHEKMGRIIMKDGNKRTQILLTSLDMVSLIEYMAYKLGKQ
jgi:hypothetical protein